MKRLCHAIGWLVPFILLVGAVAMSLWSLHNFYYVRDAEWRMEACELLMGIILGAEGLFAISHLVEARTSRRAEAFENYTREFLECESRRHANPKFRSFKWKRALPHSGEGRIPWKLKENSDPREYTTLGKNDATITITADTDEWWLMVEMADRFQFAELASRRGYMEKKDVFEWLENRPVRWWYRLGDVLVQERNHRKTPWLYDGFEKLALAVMTYNRNKAAKYKP